MSFPERQGELGSGDSLVRTMRLVSAALSGTTTVAQSSVNPQCGPGQGAAVGQALTKAMNTLEEAAKDVKGHRSIGDLMGMAD